MGKNRSKFGVFLVRTLISGAILAAVYFVTRNAGFGPGLFFILLIAALIWMFSSFAD